MTAITPIENVEERGRRARVTARARHPQNTDTSRAPWAEGPPAAIITDRDPGDESDAARCPDFFGWLWLRCERELHHEGKHQATAQGGVPFTWHRIRPGSSTVDELLETAQ